MPPVWARAIAYMVLIGAGWLVALPAALLVAEHGRPVVPLRSAPFLLAAVALGSAGVALALAAGHLLVVRGGGTPLPLDPTRALVVAGPYRYVRNPQAIAMVLLSGAEALALDAASPALLPALTLLYLRVMARWEDRQLTAAFGAPYLHYRHHVRTWVPRLRPYDPAAGPGPPPATG